MLWSEAALADMVQPTCARVDKPRLYVDSGMEGLPHVTVHTFVYKLNGAIKLLHQQTPPSKVHPHCLLPPAHMFNNSDRCTVQLCSQIYRFKTSAEVAGGGRGEGGNRGQRARGYRKRARGVGSKHSSKAH